MMKMNFSLAKSGLRTMSYCCVKMFLTCLPLSLFLRYILCYYFFGKKYLYFNHTCI